jgi:hypothetical protein
MNRLNSLRFATVAALVSFSPLARASIFEVTHDGREAVDPAVNFAADCLGEVEAEDCPARSAALQSELVEALGQLSAYDDDETVGLFQSSVDSENPQLQELALRYFAYRSTPPVDLWAKAREFFFGPAPSVGHPSAELLARSMDAVDQELSALYLEGRSRASHGGQLPEGAAFTDSWAEGSVRDRLLEDLQMFAPRERFGDETRLLMIDRFVTDLYGPTPAELDVPVTGFVTDAKLAEVVAHFTSVFGTQPFGSLAEASARQPALLLELSDLQTRLLAGDTSVAAKLQEVILELTELQNVMSAGARLSLDYLGCADHRFWIETEGGEPRLGALRRAVSVGTDAHLERTVIRYFNAEGAQATGGGFGEGGAAGEGGANVQGDAGSDATGTGGRTGSGGRNATGGIDASAGEGDDTSNPNDDSGCSCALPGRGPNGLAAWLLLALGYGAWKKRRSALASGATPR